ncbi:MAG: hypothetical protein IT319_14125 [Anaerolineae bacterium]|nr:hypothetical protein [Anaerolineae bacterium]
MMKFLKDSYNGIYVVLLKPYMPTRKAVLVLILGVLLGLLWAYAISPTTYYDSDPRTLHQSWQDEWVKLLADRYAATTNADISGNIVNLLTRVDDPLGIVERLIATPGEEANRAKLEAIRPLAEQAEPNAVTAPQPSLVANILPYVVAPVVIVIIGTIVTVLFGMFIFPNLIEPLQKRARGEKASPLVAQERKARAETARLMETRKTDFAATTDFGPPLMQRMSNYTPGFGTYDESYTIEDEQERFLGECGALISETVGTGDPAKAAAIEVWLFDKDDFVRTVTKVFVSEYAYNDPSLRSKLEAKGDLMLAQPGATVLMETNTLRLQARIVDMQYGTGPLPPNSYFEKMTLELAAWRKNAAGAPVAVTQQVIAAAPQAAPVVAPPPAAAPMRQQPNFQTPQPQRSPAMPPAMPPAAPPQQPTPGLGSTTPPLRPAVSPPSPPPRPSPSADDDPFGGTGDFTPIT